MLKQLLHFSAAGLLVLCVSCKKQYSCQCSSTFEKPGYYPYTASSVEPINKKTTKRRATQICTQAEKQILNNNTDYKKGDETLTVSCAVK